MLPETEKAGAEAPTAAESLTFVRDMLIEMRRIAISIDLRDLAYFIDVARAEAEQQSIPLASASNVLT